MPAPPWFSLVQNLWMAATQSELRAFSFVSHPGWYSFNILAALKAGDGPRSATENENAQTPRTTHLPALRRGPPLDGDVCIARSHGAIIEILLATDNRSASDLKR
jgi:hypothetical protein